MNCLVLDTFFEETEDLHFQSLILWNCSYLIRKKAAGHTVFVYDTAAITEAALAGIAYGAVTFFVTTASDQHIRATTHITCKTWSIDGLINGSTLDSIPDIFMGEAAEELMLNLGLIPRLENRKMSNVVFTGQFVMVCAEKRSKLSQKKKKKN